jgi:hypothetical protein
MAWEHNFHTSTLERFMQELFAKFQGSPLSFFNRKIVMPLASGKTAEMVLSTLGTSGQYEAIKVKIIHQVNGVIAEEAFRFKDYLMEGYRYGDRTNPTPKVIDHCGSDWYMNGPTPKAIAHLNERIWAYVSLYNK